jgi:hypothetical protein
MTCGYQRTSSPVIALPMIVRWISDVPSKMVTDVPLEDREAHGLLGSFCR